MTASDGAVKGRPHLRDDQPAEGSALYLSKYVGSDTSPLVVMNPAEDLHTETGLDGAFCFGEVAPGDYALIVYNAVDSFLLENPATGYSLEISVTPGEVSDVGIVYTPTR